MNEYACFRSLRVDRRTKSGSGPSKQRHRLDDMKTRFQGIAGKFLIYAIVIPLALVLEIPVFLAGVSLGAFVTFSRDLPEVPGLNYQPRTVSTFYADDGTVIGTFSQQKRYVVELSQIPPHVVNAFLAAEDGHFFQHHGVDWVRMVGAALRNLKARRVTQGGSTITMQVTRNFLLTRERRLSRKMKEIAVALKLDKAWGKQKILHVYLNDIYLGEGCYGVEAAARGYFDKPVEHLDIAEAALIAGLVAGPAIFNPFKSEERARQKQQAVLARMLKDGFITQEEYEKAKDEKLVFKKEVVRPFDLAPDFTEAVRKHVIRNFGEEKLLNEGLKVFTTCKVDYQQKAVEALEKGLEEIKSRQKYPAIVKAVPKEEIPEMLERRSVGELREGKIYQGVVTKVRKKGKEAFLDVGLSKHVVGLVKLESDTGVYKAGHVLALKFEGFSGETAVFGLDNDPKLQGAVVSIENRTGYVRALVGGVSGDMFKFNRAIQGKRQPGSSFKPIIYATALEEASYSPATIIIDEAISVEMDKEEPEWEPRNAGGDYLGPLPLRRALELSRNICTIKILMDVGLDPVVDMAHKMGITSDLGRNLSLSLGTSELSVIELTSAYTVFPNSGVWLEPVLVKRIEDRLGNVLENNERIPVLDEAEIPKPRPREEFADLIEHEQRTGKQPKGAKPSKPVVQSPKPSDPKGPVDTDEKASTEVVSPRKARAAISPQTAYVMTSLLQGGVRQGTGARMSRYIQRRDLAGKTGTTNQAADAWFVGFNPDYTTGVWVGFDEKRPLGSKEEGAKAALPIWGYYMRGILDNKRERDFPVPPDITFKDMLTFVGRPETGYVPKMVREPIYTPFIGQTLALCPLDKPEALAQYRGIEVPNVPAEATAGQGNPPRDQIRQVPAINPNQPGAVVPMPPAQDRNLSPEAKASLPRSVPAVAPPVAAAEQTRGMSYFPEESSPQQASQKAKKSQRRKAKPPRDSAKEKGPVK